MKAAIALDPVLASFGSITGQRLEGVRAEHCEGLLVQLVLDFGEQSIIAVADADYDTLELGVGPRPRASELVEVISKPPWPIYRAQPFAWGWLTINQQGYVDGALLGFGDDIYPKLVLNVMGSEIKVGTINFG
ncbi:MAG: hypothetical protein EPN33_10930 [Acidobacteria bacterium]|nr:MAG: hypothetical protein EPN33_10930 [Acidobacteriota bacterium]